MSLLDTRDELYAALKGAGLEIAASAGQRVPVPGVIVAPADPWIVPAPVLARDAQRISWAILPIAGRTDAEATLAQLGDLIERVWVALVALVGWSTPSVSAPRVLTVNGADHTGAELRMTRAISIGG